MTTYEEDIVDICYNLKGYFTIMNIPFSAVEKRDGGKGRGEIDVLAIRIHDNQVKEAIHIEVSVSVSSKFPSKSKTQPKTDETGKLIKKFFTNDSGHKIREIIGDTEYKRVLISSEFDSKSLDRIKERMPDFGGEILRISDKDGRINLRLKYKDKSLDIEIIPFSQVLSETKELFIKKGLAKANFQDGRYRAIQYLINTSKSKE